MSKFIPWLKERATKLNDSESANSKLASAQKQPDHGEQLVSVQQPQAQKQNKSTQLKSKLPGNKPPYHRYQFWRYLGVGSAAIAMTGAWLSLERTLPQTSEFSTSVRNQTLTIKATDGTILQQQGPATREPLQLEEMPKQLVQAFIASEDRRFYQHHGVDYQGVIRAAAANLRSNQVVEGGSSITQQLARILYLNQDRTLWRKLKEVRLAQKIEDKLTKDEILERYLNLVYLGAGAYGVADAAWVYFSKPVDQLTLSEMATIAGLAPAPSSYSPATNEAAAKQRRNLVLQRMQQDGVITAPAAATASAAPINLKLNTPKRLQVQAPYFTTYIQKELPKYVAPEVLAEGGLTVETTLNQQWQQVAEAVVKDTVEGNGRWQNFKQASMVAIDPRNGEIKAMVGGTDFGKNQFDRVTQAQRQPGSTFKGFVYTAAIASGMSPYKNYIDAPYIVDGYEPKNYSREYRGSLTMRDALALSINVIALKVLLDVGYEPTINLAHQMGIKSQLQPTASLALGAWEVNLLELSSAYGTLAAQGMHAEAHGIQRILNRNGEVIYAADYKPKRVLDKGSAAIATWMLRSVVQAGTGGAAQLSNLPVAGKTGTSDKARDLWFIGYVPQLVTGVWLGNDDNQPTSGSSSTAAYAWNRFMVKAVEGMPIEKFPELPRLAGRKGSIKAKPIKPRRVITGRSAEKQSSGGDFARSEVNRSPENYRPRRRRYRRRYNQQQNQVTPRVYRRSPSYRPETPATNDSSRYDVLLRRLRRSQSQE